MLLLRSTMGLGIAALCVSLGVGLRLTGCRHEDSKEPPVASSASASRAPRVTPLTGTVAPLQQLFNGARGKRRFIAFLSPTCPACLDGARAVRAELAASIHSDEWSVAIVWIPMRPTDDAEALDRAAGLAASDRVHQFFDGSKLAGRAFGRAAFPGFTSPAWDVYLFYGPDARWVGAQPPTPARRLAQFLGPDRRPTVASELDEDGRPVPLGPGARLGALLRETRLDLERRR